MRWLACAALAASSVAAHETITTKLTWTREISRLVIARCQACHRAGGSAPMAFETYDQTRPWARAIQEEVSDRRMPPWDASKGFAEYKHDFALTPEEIKLFNDWVEGGAPKGDDKYLPPASSKAPAWPLAWRGREVDAPDGLVLKTALRVAAVRAVGTEKAEVMALAELPDGSVEPLLQVAVLRSRWNRAYEMAAPLVLPAGTRIRVTGGSVKLGLAALDGLSRTRRPAAK